MGLIILAGLALLLVGASGCASWTAEKKAPPIGQFIDTQDARIHYLDIGPRVSEKPPVILIHGASANLRDMNIAFGDALSPERRVLIIDRPGRGYSTRGEEGWRLDRQASAIKQAADGLGIKRPVVVGQSLGGAVALAYALQYQDEMSALVLLAPVSHVWPGDVAWYNKVSQWPIIGVALRRVVVPLYAQFASADAINGSFAPNTPPPDYADLSGTALVFRPKDFRANAADVAHLKKQIAAQQTRYGELDLPVAIVTGTEDVTVSPEIHSRQLAREVAGSTLTLLPETGHALHHAQTAKIVEIIEQVIN